VANMTLDGMLDGAVKAGAIVRSGDRYDAPSPSELDALAESAGTISPRTVPADALVRTSVDSYLRAHPGYWRRLRAQVVGADIAWLATERG
jgi:hypothetical protein